MRIGCHFVRATTLIAPCCFPIRTDFNACLDAEDGLPPCDLTRSTCVDLLAAEYIGQPGKLGHVCVCRSGFGGTPGYDGSGCHPTRLTMNTDGMHIHLGRDLDVKASRTRIADTPKDVSLRALHSDITGLGEAGGAVSQVESKIESLATGPVAANTANLALIKTALDAAVASDAATNVLITEGEASLETRVGNLQTTASNSRDDSSALNGAFDSIETNLLGLATEIGDLGSDLDDLAQHVASEISEEVQGVGAGNNGKHIEERNRPKSIYIVLLSQMQRNVIVW